MTTESRTDPVARPLVRRMVARDPHESGRAATPLELLFDLCFVVAIAQGATALHHAIGHGHPWEGAGSFALVFFAIWWAWMGFTWFASAFDTDDAPYRVKVLIQMVGALVIAAGVPRAFEHFDYGLVTLGYAIMRIGLVAQWLRVARAVPEMRATALRYAGGIVLCQIGWIAILALPTQGWLLGAAVLVPLELLVPLVAELRRATPWHAHHVAERYGLMTIIVIGEAVLAATLAVQSALEVEDPDGVLLAVILGAPLLFFSMWWLYFARPHDGRLGSLRGAFVWGYAHYFVFGSAAAVGAGIAVAVEEAAHGGTGSIAAHAITVPLALYLASIWFVQVCGDARARRVTVGYAAGAAAVLVAPWLTTSLLAPGLILAGLTAWVAWATAREAPATASAD